MSAGKVIVYGGKGALGSTILEFFKKQNFWTLSIDISANDQADVNVQVNSEATWVEQEKAILEKVGAAVNGQVDGIFCVAGGWAGGDAANEDFIKNSDLMWKQSVWSSSIAARIAAKHLKEGGVLQLTGAAPAVAGTPGMIGYGMAKAAVHQLVKSLSANGSGLPKDTTVFALLPVTLDTPMNRKWMPKADFATWTSMTWVAEQLYKWVGGSSRPESGSLLKLTTVNNETTIENQ
ncbi:unnamed protein product [Auanema sp. JU1783]|nr:unnamed protein product [Auanema sp. JU1783]